MANLPISGLTSAAASLAATDVIPVVKTTGVGPVKMTGQQLATGLLGSTTLSGATVTADAPVLNLAQTWNNSGVTFTGLKANFTDTASGGSSLLLDLQTGGTSRFSVRKDGIVSSSFLITSQYVNASVALQVPSNTGAINLGTGSDTILTRRAAANLRLGAADAASPVAQTLSVQSVSAGNTNVAGANLTITGSQGTGSGAGGSIIFQVAPAGASGTAQNALSTALTIDSAGRLALPLAVNSYTANAINIGSGNGGLRYYSSETYSISLHSSSNGFGLGVSGSGASVGGTLGFGTSVWNSVDVLLTRDAANTLALRNGTNAQTFNVYNTYTDASNYERMALFYNGNRLTIGHLYAGTGSARSFDLLGADFNFRLTSGTGAGSVLWYMTTGGLFAGTDNTYDIGANTANRPRSIYAGRSITPGAGVAVASLPTPSAGMIARVTDATSPAVGSTVTGGGSAAALVWYNGANWTVIGV